jgi:hypothetical protein
MTNDLVYFQIKSPKFHIKSLTNQIFRSQIKSQKPPKSRFQIKSDLILPITGMLFRLCNGRLPVKFRNNPGRVIVKKKNMFSHRRIWLQNITVGVGCGTCLADNHNLGRARLYLPFADGTSSAGVCACVRACVRVPLLSWCTVLLLR